MSDLSQEIRTYVKTLSPHVAKRKVAKRLIEAADRIDELERATDNLTAVITEHRELCRRLRAKLAAKEAEVERLKDETQLLALKYEEAKANNPPEAL